MLGRDPKKKNGVDISKDSEETIEDSVIVGHKSHNLLHIYK